MSSSTDTAVVAVRNGAERQRNMAARAAF